MDANRLCVAIQIQTYLFLQVYHRNIPTDKDMFKQMVNLAGSKAPKEGWVERTEHGIEVHVCGHQGLFWVWAQPMRDDVTI